MRGINRIDFGGNVGRDPEISYTQDGKAIAKLSIAASRRIKGKDKDEVTWANIVCFGPLAEAVKHNLSKGDSVLASGRLSIRDYQDRDGNKRKVTEIVANEVHFLITKKKDGAQTESSDYEPGGQPPEDEEPPF
jgi:single-strand DNA-binding protein